MNELVLANRAADWRMLKSESYDLPAGYIPAHAAVEPRAGNSFDGLLLQFLS